MQFIPLHEKIPETVLDHQKHLFGGTIFARIVIKLLKRGEFRVIQIRLFRQFFTRTDKMSRHPDLKRFGQGLRSAFAHKPGNIQQGAGQRIFSCRTHPGVRSVQIFQQIGMHGRIGGKRVPAALGQIMPEEPGTPAAAEQKMLGRRPDKFIRRTRLTRVGRMQQPAEKIRHFNTAQADNRVCRAAA